MQMVGYKKDWMEKGPKLKRKYNSEKRIGCSCMHIGRLITRGSAQFVKVLSAHSVSLGRVEALIKKKMKVEKRKCNRP